jgi:hypothetical protein
VVLTRQLALSERARGNAGTAQRFEEESQLAEQYGRLILEHLLKVRPDADQGGRKDEGGTASKETA